MKQKKKSNKLLIWSDDPSDYDDSMFVDMLRDRYENPEYNPTDEEISDEFRDYVDTNYEFSRQSINIELPHCILQIADLGLWWGRKTCYRLLGDNLREVFDAFKYDYCSIYCDQYNLKGRDIHHDGTNIYTFRMLSDGIDSEKFMDQLRYGGGYSASTMRKYTRSLKPWVLKAISSH